MLYFSNAKINLGLNITSKRPDGYHNIETVFYPVKLKDAMEFIPAEHLSLTSTGIVVDCEMSQNLMVKAYQLLRQDLNLPSLAFHIHKTTPFGAGLGGGSANAAFTLIELNRFFQLELSEAQLLNYARKLGADCAFFIKNRAVFANGKGDVFKTLDLDLSAYSILLIHPGFGISTPEAYAQAKPQLAQKSIERIIGQDIATWKTELHNDFEHHLFQMHPVLAEIKSQLYQLGAIYASLSGSGSSMYGLFKHVPETSTFDQYWTWTGRL